MKDKAPLDLARGVARSTSWILTWAVSGSTWILVDLDMGGVKIRVDSLGFARIPSDSAGFAGIRQDSLGFVKIRWDSL